MTNKKRTKAPAKPLETLNATVVQTPLQGLVRNVEEALVRTVKKAAASNDREGERVGSLFLMMLRLAANSYDAVNFLLSTEDTHTKRRKEFVVLLPTFNRQLLDLMFTLVYMNDDFSTRSLEYERSGYRESREETERMRQTFGRKSDFAEYLQGKRATHALAERYLGITPEQRKDLTLIPRWPTPYQMIKGAPTKSRKFLRFLENRIYGPISEQAHLQASGLFSVGIFFLPDFASVAQRAEMETRRLEQFKFQQYALLVMSVLAILNEVEVHFGLSNRTSLAYLWSMLGGYSPEVKAVYDERYQAMLV